jgi:hypothetical protein
MQGRGRRPWWGLILAAAVGCGHDAPPPPPEPAQVPTPATAFDPATAGSITGRVTWDGEPSNVLPFPIYPNALGGDVFRERHARPNPNAPSIDPLTRGIADAVVYLRGVEVARARPWDHPPLVVEIQSCCLHLRQGDAGSRVGFVRRGDRLAMVSREPVFHLLHAGEAAFFTLAFPDPEQPRERPLKEIGLVELTSAAGYYWMRGYVFVDEHPYYARTDREGRFALPRVPPGRYEIVCWAPNWVKQRHERDPETGEITRLFFRPPAEQVRTVTVAPGADSAVQFTLSETPFRETASGVSPSPPAPAGPDARGRRSR